MHSIICTLLFQDEPPKEPAAAADEEDEDDDSSDEELYFSSLKVKMEKIVKMETPSKLHRASTRPKPKLVTTPGRPLGDVACAVRKSYMQMQPWARNPQEVYAHVRCGHFFSYLDFKIFYYRAARLVGVPPKPEGPSSNFFANNVCYLETDAGNMQCIPGVPVVKEEKEDHVFVQPEVPKRRKKHRVNEHEIKTEPKEEGDEGGEILDPRGGEDEHVALGSDGPMQAASIVQDILADALDRANCHLSGEDLGVVQAPGSDGHGGKESAEAGKDGAADNQGEKKKDDDAKPDDPRDVGEDVYAWRDDCPPVVRTDGFRYTGIHALDPVPPNRGKPAALGKAPAPHAVATNCVAPDAVGAPIGDGQTSCAPVVGAADDACGDSDCSNATADTEPMSMASLTDFDPSTEGTGGSSESIKLVHSSPPVDEEDGKYSDQEMSERLQKLLEKVTKRKKKPSSSSKRKKETMNRKDDKDQDDDGALPMKSMRI